MARKERTSVGVIGLGIIGSRIAANLRKAGYQVWLWNRSPRAEPNFLSSPAEVAESARFIQIFVNDGQALFETVDRMLPALTPEHIVMNHATVAPADTQSAAQRVATTGARFLDAPFTGSRNAAEEGQLVYYVGGDSDAFEMARPVLEKSSKAIVEIGEVGEASTVKIATNMIAASTVEALAEAMCLLHHANIPLENLGKALEHSAHRSGLTDSKVETMIEGDFTPHFSLKNMFKDMQLALELANSHSVDLPVVSAFAGAAMSSLQKGWGDEDFSVLARQYGFPREERQETGATSDPAKKEI